MIDFKGEVIKAVFSSKLYPDSLSISSPSPSDIKPSFLLCRWCDGRRPDRTLLLRSETTYYCGWRRLSRPDALSLLSLGNDNGTMTLQQRSPPRHYNPLRTPSDSTSPIPWANWCKTISEVKVFYFLFFFLILFLHIASFLCGMEDFEFL